MQTIDRQTAAERLKAANDVLILTHQNPDGDTLGCAFALCAALKDIGKRAAVKCPGPLPEKYSFIYPQDEDEEFEPEFIVAVDLASPGLMGKFEYLAPKVDLSIDHHPTNTGFARETCLDAEAGAAGEIVYDIITLMGADISGVIADALYLAVNSDTGCFRYSSTRAQSLKIAASLMERGARTKLINNILYESKPREMVSLEGKVLSDISFYHDGLCALIRLPLETLNERGISPDDVDGLSSIPRRIKGVEVGITLREREDGACRISLRTKSVDASVICAKFGGGGHKMASGCTIVKPLAEAEADIISAVGDALKEAGLIG